MIKEYDITLTEDGRPELTEKYSFDYESCEFVGPEILYLLNELYHLSSLDSEAAYLVSMDFYRHPLAIYQVSLGDYKTCNMYNRTIALFILLSGARSFLVVHNHPDIEYMPSSEDLANKYILQDLANFFDIEFDGSFVISRGGWCEVGKDKLEEWI